MAGSLQDQLIKAGLASASQAKKAAREKRAETHARRKGKKTASASSAQSTDSGSQANAHTRARAKLAEKTQRDKERARAQNEKTAARGIRAEITQIILQNDLRSKQPADDDVPYNFVHGKKIKRIHIPRTQREALTKGSMVIVNNDGIYHIVTRAVADQIESRDPKRIIVSHGNEQVSSPDDDFYANFEVPDDLDW
ncbi:MAG: DUF2058 family protein [Pseudomonadales bacterium]|jgi:hypothetical protein|nr:DUF2058 family protein [Pseudomonadales bacterium]MDP6469764.1 DUF2058 family protein [Pseudomonadales bacterium]MDP6827634.1 DUF2058 family protein [Pseudomonadales bacterium]MDP6972407.1 DUF2058 family protein [Pseudomonadales bacterium]|tara:strand:+ start:1223 stop:1810 length:588 start_codon:yes stop_codon:yes gene_type:complete